MKTKFLYFVVLVLSATTWFACTNSSTPNTETKTVEITPPPPKPESEIDWITVDKNRNVTLFGKKIAFEDLKSLLQDTFVKSATIPRDVPIKFDENLLMGVRGDVKSEVLDAINGAKIYKVMMSDKAEDMVKNFYAWYFDKINDGSAYILSQNKGDAESTLSNQLYKSLLKKEKDGPDADYFIQAQDYDNDWGTVTFLDKTPPTASNVMTFKIQLGGTLKDSNAIGGRKLKVTVKDTKPGWRIDKVVAID